MASCGVASGGMVLLAVLLAALLAVVLVLAGAVLAAPGR